MAQMTLLSRIALGAGGALIIGAAALAQTSPPTAPPAAPPASRIFPPTATITTPGYPGVGPADSKLRVMNLPNGKKLHLLPATLDTTQWGWFDNAQPPVLRVNSGDTVVLETMMHSHNQVVPGTTIEQIKKTAHRFSRPRAAYVDRPDLHRGGAAGRRAQGHAQQDRAARLCDELQRARHVRPIPERLSGRPGQIPLSRSRQDGDRVPARRRDAAQAVPGHDRRRAQGAGPLSAACRPANSPATWTSAISSPARSLYVPVHVPGALLWTGDSHAGQGNGEVNLTAIETAYKEFNITVEVIKGKPLDFPRIETREVLDHDGLRPGSEQGLGAGQGADRQVPLRAAQRLRRASRRS